MNLAQQANMHDITKAVIDCVSSVQSGWRRATCFLARNLTVKATRQFPRRKNERQINIVVTIGKPNFSERRYIRHCGKTHAIFPVSDPHLEAFK